MPQQTSSEISDLRSYLPPGMTGFRRTACSGTYFHPPIPMFVLLARSIVYRFVQS